MEPTIATGLEYLAIELESHIKFYVPKGWRESINSAASCPMLSGEETKVLIEAYNEKRLKSTLEELSKSDDFPYRQLKPFFVKEAIEDYFTTVFEKKYAGKDIDNIGKQGL